MNQIDNHFSKKLRDLEIKPSDRADQLFMSKVAPQKKDNKLIWKYFALAASVMLALGVLFVLNSNVLSTDTALVLPQEQTQIKEASEEAEANEKPEPATEEFIQVTEPKQTLASVTLTKYEKSSQIQNKMNYEEVNTETNRLNLGNLKKLNSEKTYSYQENDLVDYTLIDVITNKLDLISENSPMEQNQEIKLKEKPLIAKVINEVKYLVHGEKLDLERAGIKPAATALAHNPSGLLASETQQFRENVHRIKEIFK